VIIDPVKYAELPLTYMNCTSMFTCPLLCNIDPVILAVGKGRVDVWKVLLRTSVVPIQLITLACVPSRSQYSLSSRAWGKVCRVQMQFQMIGMERGRSVDTSLANVKHCAPHGPFGHEVSDDVRQ
jgi:hypothetical protein